VLLFFMKTRVKPPKCCFQLSTAGFVWILHTYKGYKITAIKAMTSVIPSQRLATDSPILCTKRSHVTSILTHIPPQSTLARVSA
jgi:hypothetical protein